MSDRPERCDDAIVGAGILGLALAWRLAARGRRVTVLEKDPAALGASVRNFGTLWPIGQPPGPWRDLALRSLALWRELLEATGLWSAPTGALFVAHHEDEAAVLKEFAQAAPDLGYGARLVDTETALERWPALRPNHLHAVLHSPEEIGIDPRATLATLPRWLSREHGVRIHFSRFVTRAEPGLVAGPGWEIPAERVWVCSGAETRALWPSVFQELGARAVKLQMLRALPQRPAPPLGAVIAGGLTLRHYESFSLCPSLPALRARIAAQRPAYDEFGIHVMAAQLHGSEILIGDSHQPWEEAGPFDLDQIDRLVLEVFDELLDLPRLRILERWNGVYLKHEARPLSLIRPAEKVAVVAAAGGAGMTFSMGAADALAAAAAGGDLTAALPN